jgi:hypothetical protein
MSELMADNGAYFLTAYAVFLGGLGGYAVWLQRRLRSAQERQSGRD